MTRISGAGATEKNAMTDDYGRSISYLRLSVTDRCNLRCLYCEHSEGFKLIPHARIATYEDLLDLVEVAVSLGVNKLRLTGGEPFARKGFMDFLGRIRERWPDLALNLTSNGTLLREHVAGLKDLRVNGINISLDTFSPEKFAEITGSRLFKETMDSVRACLEAGLRLKINAVALRGVNDDELPLFVDFAARNGVDVRFIEYMPMGGRGRWSEANFWPAEDILQKASRCAELVPAPAPERIRNSGPARMFLVNGGPGRLGLISPLSNHFCTNCNRLRVTSDGRLRTCLFSDREYAMLPMLRHPKLGKRAVRRLFSLANRHKPLGTELLNARKNRESVISGRMSAIGG